MNDVIFPTLKLLEEEKRGLKNQIVRFVTNQHTVCVMSVYSIVCVCVAELTPTWTQTRLWPT